MTHANGLNFSRLAMLAVACVAAWWPATAGATDPALNILGGMGGVVDCVRASGNVAVVARGLQLYAIDVGTPSAPDLIGQVAIGGKTSDIAITGSYGAISLGAQGIQVVYFGGFGGMIAGGIYDTPGTAQAMAVAGTSVLVADGSKLLIFSVSSLDGPTLVGQYNSKAIDVVANGTTAYVLDDQGLKVLNVSNPKAPVLSKSLPVEDGACLTYVGGYAYIGAGKLMHIINVNAVGGPKWEGVAGLPEPVEDVEVTGSRAAALGGGQLMMVDISNRKLPLTKSSVSAGGSVRLSLATEAACLADPTAGLRLYNISNATNPFEITTWNLPSLRGADLALAPDLAGFNQFLCVADASKKLQLINIEDPAQPGHIGAVATAGAPLGMTVAGQFAYLSEGSSGVQTFNVKFTNQVSPVARLDTPGSAQNCAIDGETMYVADGSAGVQVVDISSPGNPAIKGAYNTAGFAYDMAVRHPRAFVADGENGIVVLNADVTPPTRRATYDTAGKSLGLALDNLVLYVADGANGLLIYDSSDTKAMRLLGRFDTPGTANRFIVRDRIAWVADGAGGIWGIDVADPANPKALVSSPACPAAKAVALQGTSVLACDDQMGLVNFEFQGDAPAALDKARFTASTFPATMPWAGGPVGVNMVVQNEGSSSWSRAEGVELRVVQDTYSMWVGEPRVQLAASSTVPPMGSWTFNGQIVGLRFMGPHTIKFRMARGGVEFGETLQATVIGEIQHNAARDWTSYE